MFYLTSQKVKFALNTALAALLVAAAIFLTTYDFNAAEWFNRILEGESFSAMILKAFVGGNADNNFFFGNIGLAMAIIAACYVGYLAGIFLDDYKTAIGVILTILCVVGIIGLFALKSLLLFSALVTDGYKFNGVGMIWTFEFFEMLVIVITAVVSCFRRGLRRYSLFILAYFLGVFVCFIWLFLGFGLCVGLCVAVGVCRGDEDYGSFATSYSSGSSASSRSSGSYSSSSSRKRSSTKNKNYDYDDDEEDEILEDIKWTAPPPGFYSAGPAYADDEPINWSSCYASGADDDGNEHTINTITGRDEQGNLWQSDPFDPNEYHMVERADDDDD